MILLLTLLAIANTEVQEAQSLLIGVLEHHDSRWPAWPEEERPQKDNYVIRLVFEMTRTGWKSLEREERQSKKWFVGFDGKKVGSISSRWTQSNSYSEKGLHRPAADAKIPKIGMLTKEFGNWVDDSVPRYRPLVLNTLDAFADPNEWKPFRPSKNELAMSRASFRRKAGKFVFGDSKHGDTPSADYSDNSILLKKAYHSNSGELLIDLLIDYNLFHVDGPIEESTEYWIHIGKNGKAIALDIQGPLVDAGDYDGDGDSEIVFAYSGYNEDGYIMLFDKLGRTIRNTWNYH